MRLKIHWVLESFIFWILFIVIYLVLDDLLTTKSNGLNAFLSWIFFAMPMYLIVVLSFFFKHRLASTNGANNIIILQLPPIVYFFYNLYHSFERFLNKLLRDFPIEGDWLIYFTYLILTIIFSINMKWRGK